MNHKIHKDFDEFILNGELIFVVEKALYALIDKFKRDRINGQTEFSKNFDKTIDKCFNFLKLHENYNKNPEVFEITIHNDLDEELATEELEPEKIK